MRNTDKYGSPILFDTYDRNTHIFIIIRFYNKSSTISLLESERIAKLIHIFILILPFAVPSLHIQQKNVKKI